MAYQYFYLNAPHVVKGSQLEVGRLLFPRLAIMALAKEVFVAVL